MKSITEKLLHCYIVTLLRKNSSVVCRNTLQQSSNGFTLIEILVVLSVVGILSVAGIAAFVDYSRKETINSATQELFTTLASAKSRAQSQVKPGIGTCEKTAGQDLPLDGYKVQFADSTTYKLFAVCGGEDNEIQEKTLPSGIEFGGSEFVEGASFLFESITGAANEGSITIASEFSEKTITVSATGVIQSL